MIQLNSNGGYREFLILYNGSINWTCCYVFDNLLTNYLWLHIIILFHRLMQALDCQLTKSALFLPYLKYLILNLMLCSGIFRVLKVQFYCEIAMEVFTFAPARETSIHLQLYNQPYAQVPFIYYVIPFRGERGSKNQEKSVPYSLYTLTYLHF